MSDSGLYAPPAVVETDDARSSPSFVIEQRGEKPDFAAPPLAVENASDQPQAQGLGQRRVIILFSELRSQVERHTPLVLSNPFSLRDKLLRVPPLVQARDDVYAALNALGEVVERAEEPVPYDDRAVWG